MKKTSFLFFMFLALFSHGQYTLQKQYGDTVDCSGLHVIQTNDNGFLIIASKNPVSQFYDDLFVIKTDQMGDTLWTKTHSLESGFVGAGIQTADGGFVITGKTGIYLFLMKLTEVGDIWWSVKYNFGTTYANGISVIESGDHDLYVVGENFIGEEVCCAPLVLKTDAEGNILDSFNLPYAENGRAYDIVETPDSNFVISYSSIYMGPPDPQLIKVDKNGNTLWHKAYDSYCECHVNLTHDNGFIISGHQVNTYKPYLIKTDSAGNIIWNKSYSDYHVFNYDLKVTQATDNGYLMVGGMMDSVSDLIILKINSLGDSVWGRTYGGTDEDFGNSIITTNDNGFAIVGYTRSFGSDHREVWFLKTDSLGLITSTRKYPITEKHINIYPNPFSNSTTLKANTEFKNLNVSVLNALGQKIKQFDNINGTSFTLYRNDLPKGIYFLQLAQKDDFVAIEKVIIIDN